MKKRGRKEGKDGKVEGDFQAGNFLTVSVALILYMSEKGKISPMDPR